MFLWLVFCINKTSFFWYSFFFFFLGSAELPTHSIVVFFSIVFQLNELEVLKKRIKALEDSSHPSVDNLIVKLKEYSLRKEGDFDKYREDLVALALQKDHEKAHYYKVVLESLKERFDKPIAIFRSYYQALVGDSAHSKVMETLGKVDKAASKHSRPQRSAGDRHCFYCGVMGHVVSQCRKRLRRNTSQSYHQHQPGYRGPK